MLCADPECGVAGPDDPIGGGITEIALARNPDYHTLPEGPMQCSTTLSAL